MYRVKVGENLYLNIERTKITIKQFIKANTFKLKAPSQFALQNK